MPKTLLLRTGPIGSLLFQDSSERVIGSRGWSSFCAFVLFAVASTIPVQAQSPGFAVDRPSNVTWYVSIIATGQTYAQQWGLPGDVPVPGDYGGDGITDSLPCAITSKR